MLNREKPTIRHRRPARRLRLNFQNKLQFRSLSENGANSANGRMRFRKSICSAGMSFCIFVFYNFILKTKHGRRTTPNSAKRSRSDENERSPFDDHGFGIPGMARLARPMHPFGAGQGGRAGQFRTSPSLLAHWRRTCGKDENGEMGRRMARVVEPRLARRISGNEGLFQQESPLHPPMAHVLRRRLRNSETGCFQIWRCVLRSAVGAPSVHPSGFAAMS